MLTQITILVLSKDILSTNHHFPNGEKKKPFSCTVCVHELINKKAFVVQANPFTAALYPHTVQLE